VNYVLSPLLTGVFLVVLIVLLYVKGYWEWPSKWCVGLGGGVSLTTVAISNYWGRYLRALNAKCNSAGSGAAVSDRKSHPLTWKPNAKNRTPCGFCSSRPRRIRDPHLLKNQRPNHAKSATQTDNVERGSRISGHSRRGTLSVLPPVVAIGADAAHLTTRSPRPKLASHLGLSVRFLTHLKKERIP
jgi:hypothetical protein